MVELDRLRLYPMGIARLLEEAPQLSGLALRLLYHGTESIRKQKNVGPLVLATALHSPPPPFRKSLEWSLPQQDAVYTTIAILNFHCEPAIQSSKNAHVAKCTNVVTQETYLSSAFEDLSCARSTMSIRVRTVHRVAGPERGTTTSGTIIIGISSREMAILRKFTVPPTTVTVAFSATGLAAALLAAQRPRAPSIHGTSRVGPPKSSGPRRWRTLIAKAKICPFAWNVSRQELPNCLVPMQINSKRMIPVIQCLILALAIPIHSDCFLSFV